MKKIIFVAFVLFTMNTKAQYVTIPDANFVAYLQSIVPSAMSGNQLDTTNTLVTTTTHSINCSGMWPVTIVNIFGIKYFKSLTYLKCIGNKLITIPTLPNSITYLDCDNSQVNTITNIPTSLVYLYCYSNGLASLPTLPNSLIYIDCSNNANLTNLPALPNSLTYLNCSNNGNLSTLPPLPNSLTYLNCSGSNSPFSLPALPNSLTHLNCSGYNTHFTSLPALPNSLTYLNCSLNSISSLPTLPASLDTLYCQSNNITCFPSFPNSITALNIVMNLYNCLPNYISAMTAAELATPLCVAGNTNGCAVAGIQQFANNNELNIYPNPNNGSFIIEPSGATKQTMQVYDVNGKLVLTQTINGKTSIDASNLAEGVYNISLQINEGVVNKRLVIVQ